MGTKKIWTDKERLELVAKLDDELDEYINNLAKKRYTEGWSEDKWQEEMDKDPFFMKKAPEPGEELSPLMEGLQQLKYGEDENTPEELANNYKEDGNFNYKHKKYRIAIISYSQGIITDCKDDDLMAQLYNNRAAAHFMLQNYRLSLSDSKLALMLKQDYPKALNRAALCSFYIKDYDQCIELCDRFLDHSSTDKVILKLKADAANAKKCAQRDERKQKRLEEKLKKRDEKLLEIISREGINVELPSNKQKLKLSHLEHQIPYTNRVYLDDNEKLVWPVMILYPETKKIDIIQDFHEDTPLIELLSDIFREPHDWDTDRRYSITNINVYFQDEKSCVHEVNMQSTLGEILRDKRFLIRCGTPAFNAFVKSSDAEKRFLAQL